MSVIDRAGQRRTASLRRIAVDKNSWVCRGGLAAGQSVERFMDGAARKIARELSAAKGASDPRASDP